MKIDGFFWAKAMRVLRNAIGVGYSGKSVKPKNPRRVEGGKKAAITRKANKAAQVTGA